MAFVKPEKKREGVKFLFFGEAGSGKTPTGLSFPDQALIDSDSGTNFYDDSNVLTTSSTLSFKELNDDLDDLERDDELFEQIKTFNIDSITRFHENQTHAMLKVVENRARKNGRPVDGEGLSTKEYGVMKLHYDRFFARMLSFAKLGKNLVFVAEQKDKTESRSDANGNQVQIKIGVMPNMQKGSDYDFDVVVNTFKKNGESFGIVEKDRTNTFKVGTEIEKPHYSHWKEAIEHAQKGNKREKSEVKNFEEVLKKEADSLISDEDKIQQLIKQIADKAPTLTPDNKTKLGDKMKELLKTLDYKKSKDHKKLQDLVEFMNSLE